ncbi:MAG: hypothetical protein ACJAVI_005793 [Candidatus Azotimanducaceae bacterium]
MIYYVSKIAITTVLIVVISEIAKRSSFVGAVLASIPLISVLAMVWLYVDTQDLEKISALSISVFWLVLPSLVLFVSLPLMLKQGFHFYTSISLSIGLTALAYWGMVTVLDYVGIEL